MDTYNDATFDYSLVAFFIKNSSEDENNFRDYFELFIKVKCERIILAF
jgi:hypothetical protein